MKKVNDILRTFWINPLKWDKFKAKAKDNNSDASKEIRNMIDKYIKK